MRYFLYISYVGTRYHGWQTQKNANTIQSELNDSLYKFFGKKIKTIGGGRTDAGVHAINQVAHFDYDEKINISEFLYKTNSILPSDISVNDSINVSEQLHARHDAINRKYIYKMHINKNPFLKDLSYYYNKKININLLNDACEILKSNQDFKSFCKVKTDVTHYRCSVKKIQWSANNNDFIFEIESNRFLRGMVRTIVGTMLQLNEGKMNLKDFEKIILSGDRKNAGLSVFSGGLYLKEISYPNNWKPRN